MKWRTKPGGSLHVPVTDAGVVVPLDEEWPTVLITGVSGGDVYCRLGGAAVAPTAILSTCDRCLIDGAFEEPIERDGAASMGFRTMTGVAAVVELSPAQEVQ